MVQQSWAELQQLIAGWGAHSSDADGLSTDLWIDTFHVRFPEIVEYICAHASPGFSLGGQALWVAASVHLLRPSHSISFQISAMERILRVIEREAPRSDVDRCMDIVVAWGCGWGRTVKHSSNPWEGTWTKAIMVLRRVVEASVHHTVQLLKDKCDELDEISRDHIRMYADIITLEIAHSKCSCGAHVKKCKDPSTHKCCRLDHRLSSWQPVKRTLRSFIAETVRGNAGKSLLVGAYSTSALYTRVREDFRLEVGTVEFKRCHKCGERYEGNRCGIAGCRASADPYYTRHEARKNWLLIPYDSVDGRGRYAMQLCWSCPSCRNLFPLALERCPLCHGAGLAPRHGKLPSSVWVYLTRRPNRREWSDTVSNELDEDLE
jgi:hypothetical protein